MKRFHTITAIFAGLVLLLTFLPSAEPVRIPMLISMLFLYVFILVYGAARISSQLFLAAVCRGDAAGGKIAITFDDGPHGERSVEILELLRKYKCQASFFLIGKKAELAPGIVTMMLKDGHLVGNHSYSHSSFFPFYRAARIRAEVARTNRILEAAAGSGPIAFFRPPFGVTNPNVAGGLKDSGMKVAGWSIRSFDTRNQAANIVVERIVRRMGAGDVILLHETSEHILEILVRLLPAIKEAGLSCARLDEMFP